MVSFTNFDEFYQQSKELFLANPTQTRYTLKHRPSEQRIYYKVTDNSIVYQFYTESQVTAKETDRMNTMMILLMSMPSITSEAVDELLQTTNEGPEKKKTVSTDKKKKNKD